MRSAIGQTRSVNLSQPAKAADENGDAASRARPDPGFGVYIHWPFCLQKCPYCDFNSHVRDTVDQAGWAEALARETGYFASLAPARKVTSIFFGGGTPSLMDPASVETVLKAIGDHWTVDANAEITLEANPTSVEAEHFAGYRAAGVNRLSLGVQALNDADLKGLGRGHSAIEARAALELAKRVFPRVSFDLIYARPGQSVGAWAIELAEAIPLIGDHVSLYQLTLEPGTPFYAMAKRGSVTVPSEDEAVDMFEATQAIMNAAGMPAYEVSNHAKPGAESRHNLTYWRYGEYAGIGPGAHGRLTVRPGMGVNGSAGGPMAFRQKRSPENWLKFVGRRGDGTDEALSLDPYERAAEMLMMGMRLSEGVDMARFHEIAGQSIEEFIGRHTLVLLIDEGLVDHTPERFAATVKGRRLLNSVLKVMLGG
jgi:putative oxygen-independent coproporphyrinogen III oxidase